MRPEDFGKVAVLMGGMSPEREVSLKSGAAVLAALKNTGIDAIGIDVDRDVIETLRKECVDIAFNILHGTLGEDGVIQGALELAGIRYTGSGVMASALCMDKLRSRRVLAASGIATPHTVVLEHERDFDDAIAALGLPMAVKPNGQGSSVGVSKVEKPGELKDAYDIAAALDDIVLAESWIEGRELHAAILGGEALPLVWVEARAGFYDYRAKYESNDTVYHCPAGIDEEPAVRTLALRAFEVLGCEAWGRVDLLRDVDGDAYVLEVNTLPGMTDHSLVPMAASAAGIEFEHLVLKILEQAHGQ